MNNYLRKLLKGSTPEAEIQKCIGKEFTIPIQINRRSKETGDIIFYRVVSLPINNNEA